ncbi:hypothetical protein SAMCCGM7_Ch0195 [Sinorhizobium americanum CCGM7]|nr:hypothetical protein SAMCCGM7_Ch0195 [Sinorhizobium americanum CCGM7]
MALAADPTARCRLRHLTELMTMWPIDRKAGSRRYDAADILNPVGPPDGD